MESALTRQSTYVKLPPMTGFLGTYSMEVQHD